MRSASWTRVATLLAACSAAPFSGLGCANDIARAVVGGSDAADPGSPGDPGADDAGVPDLGAGDDAGGAGPARMSCSPTMSDLKACACDTAGQVRACYPGGVDPKTRHVGACRDGMQTCASGGEFAAWGACTNFQAPAKENCTDKIDNNCDGRVDCLDPSCATDPACRVGCVNGQMRPCYDGPMGTDGVGACHGGMQVCANNKWPASCPGEQLPTKESCADNLDHDCNHLPGCLDILNCINDPACMPGCKPDPGCVCPQGSGEFATCPDGMLGVNKGGGLFQPGTVECCPCTKNDCGNPGCCAEAVCLNNALCDGYKCKPLPPECKGQVGFDCDDFPEDCDVTCCHCTLCP